MSQNPTCPRIRSLPQITMTVNHEAVEMDVFRGVHLQNPPSITTDHRRRLTRLAKKRRNGGQIAASDRQKLIALHQGG
ncbi:hypothetical protein MesoLj131c_68070 (plasmid) [Mesorhizobium sp. 131-3-5]|nr:hypothetical protein MesoLj131c_68070 [Mesorhizobium sp. 131-3-5]